MGELEIAMCGFEDVGLRCKGWCHDRTELRCKGWCHDYTPSSMYSALPEADAFE